MTSFVVRTAFAVSVAILTMIPAPMASMVMAMRMVAEVWASSVVAVF